MEILVLPREVQEQIAAGEVVERPSHMIKELIENSLDAGATKITIEYSDSGREVRLEDNGHGISESNLEKATLRFATSKIAESDDLWSLKTFGFRGEALASIASVCRMKIKSKTSSQKLGHQIQILFGNRISLDEVSHEVGTTITIQGLFENVPARLKFLKSEAAEHGQIRQTLKALALSNHHVEFHVKEKNEMLFYWPACESRLQRAQQVIDQDSLFEGHAERGSVKAWAVMSAPNKVAKTARQIWMFAQGRWIQDRTIQAAVMEAYRGLLMHGEYPYAVVWLETNPAEVDVNIHPTKSQVKFLDNSLVFRATQAAVRETLEKAPWISDLQKTNSVVSMQNDQSSQAVSFMQSQFSSADLGRVQYQQKNWTSAKDDGLGSTEIKIEPQAGMQAQPQEPFLQTAMPSAANSFWSHLQILGQGHLTYILAQSSSSLFLIDQHAAHERVVYEKLMRAWKNGRIEVQDFLFPISFDLSAEQLEALLKMAVSLEKFGFRFERLGPLTVGVQSAPALLKSSKWISVIESLAQELVDQGESFRIEEKISDLCASMACHSVVRAGQSLSADEMHALLIEMDEFPLSSFCPHGRPVYIEKPFFQIEKEFGRRL